MDYADTEQDIVCCPIFNFKDFLKTSFLTDCELLFHDTQDGPVTSVIKAHRLVLANSSDLFSNTFTAGMQESVTGKVDIFDNPKNILPRVIDWMYSGKIEFTLNDYVPLIHVAHSYGICGLEDELLNFLNSTIDEKTIMPLVIQCYDLSYPNELKLLEPYILKYFEIIPISEMSDALDVATFARIITKKENLDTEARIVKTTEFLGDWDPTEEERNALLDAMGRIDENLRQLVKKHKVGWLPQRFLNSCK